MTDHDPASLLEIARRLVRGPSLNQSKGAGFDVKSGERILMVVRSLDDPAVTDAIVEAIHELGAKVDLVRVDVGPNRPLDPLDELRVFMKNVEQDPDYESKKDWSLGLYPWATRLAEQEKYDLLILGTGGILRKLDGPRWEGHPFVDRASFGAAAFPWPLWDLINKKAWEPIWAKGDGGFVHLTDPEGTDLHYTLPSRYFDGRHHETASKLGTPTRFREQYYLGHLWGRPTPPYEDEDDGEGVAAGTQNHYSPAFPHIKVQLKRNQVVDIEGGGEYGDGWRRMLALTKDIKYPEFSRPGLFQFFEGAIGTHPKAARPTDAFTTRGGSAMIERLRSGIVHIGIGTTAGPSQDWAEQKGVPYGHLHVHCNFPTFKLTARDGEVFTIIDKGHLTALDDPDVIELASNFGDPASLLKEDWWAPVPGISVPGDYWRDYAADPMKWLSNFEAHGGWSGDRP